jgi:hypothetical protein
MLHKPIEDARIPFQVCRADVGIEQEIHWPGWSRWCLRSSRICSRNRSRPAPSSAHEPKARRSPFSGADMATRVTVTGWPSGRPGVSSSSIVLPRTVPLRMVSPVLIVHLTNGSIPNDYIIDRRPGPTVARKFARPEI